MKHYLVEFNLIHEVLADDEEEAIEEARLYFCENHYYLHDYINLTSCNIYIDKPL